MPDQDPFGALLFAGQGPHDRQAAGEQPLSRLIRIGGIEQRENRARGRYFTTIVAFWMITGKK